MSDDIYRANCFYCTDPVNPLNKGTWHRVIGWERTVAVRASGKKGGSDIALREPRDEYACDQCVRRLQQGIPTGQRALL